MGPREVLITSRLIAQVPKQLLHHETATNVEILGVYFEYPVPPSFASPRETFNWMNKHRPAVSAYIPLQRHESVHGNQSIRRQLQIYNALSSNTPSCSLAVSKMLHPDCVIKPQLVPSPPHSCHSPQHMLGCCVSVVSERLFPISAKAPTLVHTHASEQHEGKSFYI